MDRMSGDFETRQLLTLWRMRAHRAAQIHYKQSESSGRQNKLLIVINALLSLAVLFFTNAQWLKNILSHQRKNLMSSDAVPTSYSSVQQLVNSLEATPLLFVILTSISGLLLVITTIIQYILNDGERCSNHKMAASEFSNLQRKIERYLLAETVPMTTVHNINREYNHITKAFPSVARKHWKNTDNKALNYNIQRLEEKLDARFLELEEGTEVQSQSIQERDTFPADLPPAK